MAVLDYAVVTGTPNLNLREGPGTQYDVAANYLQGTWVGILGESGNWYQVIVLSSQKQGYMSKNYLTRSNPSTPIYGGGTGVVNNPNPSQFLNLRQYPSYDAPVLGIYYNGAAFQVLSYSNGWYQVNINGIIGYFRQEFVRISGSSGGDPVGGQTAFVRTPNGGKVNLRSFPSYQGSTILAQFLNGSQVTVLNQNAGGGFWQVTIQGLTGYMDSAFLSLSTSPFTPKPETQGYATVNNPKATQVLNLRSQPSATASVVAQYRNGVRFEVIQAGKTWTKVYGSATGNIGYFMTKYLSLSSAASFYKTVRNGNSYVNLRSAPSKQNGTVYEQVPSGATVTVLTPGDEWSQVKYGNTTGYMMTYFLK